MTSLMLIVAGVVFPQGLFDCTVDVPRWLDTSGSTVQVRTLSFPNNVPADWTFEAEFSDGNGVTIRPNAADPLGLKGVHGIMTTGPNSYAFATYAYGGCALTEGGCAAAGHFVTQADGSLRLLVLPSMTMALDGAPRPEPVNAIVPGRCVRRSTTH